MHDNDQTEIDSDSDVAACFVIHLLACMLSRQRGSIADACPDASSGHGFPSSSGRDGLHLLPRASIYEPTAGTVACSEPS